MEMMILFGTLGRRKRGGELQNGSRCLFGQVQGYESPLWAGHICAIIPSNTHKNKLVTSAGLTFSGNSNHNPPFQGPSFQALPSVLAAGAAKSRNSASSASLRTRTGVRWRGEFMFPAPVNVFEQCVRAVLSRHIWIGSEFVQVVMLAVWRGEAPGDRQVPFSFLF